MASKAVSNRPLGRSVPAKRGTVDDTGSSAQESYEVS